MELNSAAIHDAVHPTAAFVHSSEPRTPSSIQGQRSDPGATWEVSWLNPKNRIDNLDDIKEPLWRIDGCSGLGTQFFAVPLFVAPVPPLRIDVFIPEDTPTELRHALEMNEAFHTKDKARVSRLAISKHILRKLQHWTSTLSDPVLWYKSLPFGSRIVMGNLDANLGKINIRIAHMHDLERQFISVDKLEHMWKRDGISLPQQLQLDSLEIVDQLHESVCMVRLPDGRVKVLKALTSYPKFLYAELRNLLRIPAHPNIIARPAYIVTKRCKFGNKNAVVGFLLPYHPSGGLRDILPFRRIHGVDGITDGLKWARQITVALVHLHEANAMFYPDLRVENMVLSRDDNIVMVDFEQRGVWCEFSAPEVNFLDYMLLISRSDRVPEQTRERMEKRIRQLLPYDLDRLESAGYDETLPAFNVAWLCLNETEQEMAEVYMLGRVLWCVFEGVSAPQRAAVWQSYTRESHLDFPDYDRTPVILRGLIDSCTRGRRRTLGEKVGRVGSRLVVLASRQADAEVETAAVREAAKNWWTEEMKDAERFLHRRQEAMARGDWDGNPFKRPTLREVLRVLETVEGGMK
jgi:hypothetical protein